MLAGLIRRTKNDTPNSLFMDNLFTWYAKRFFNVFPAPFHGTIAHASSLRVQFLKHQYTFSYPHILDFLYKNILAKAGEIKEHIENLPIAEILFRPFFF